MQSSVAVRHLWATALHHTPVRAATAASTATALQRCYHQHAKLSAAFHPPATPRGLHSFSTPSLHSHCPSPSQSVQSQQRLLPRRHFSAQQHQHITPTQHVAFEGRTYQPAADIPMPNLHWNGRPRIAERSNIALVGPPGSGKSTVAKILCQKLGMKALDVDDDLLESAWNTTVASKLSELGDKQFLQEEAKLTQQLDVQNTIISLSGSNPLIAATTEYLSRTCTFIYLDISKECILKRLTNMKVDRIVGQQTHSLDEILEYRRATYENSYDIRVVVPYKDENHLELVDHTTAEAIAEQVYDRYKHYSNQQYSSTRGYATTEYNTHVELLDAIRIGLAPDRGLFIAELFQPFIPSQLSRLLPLSYPEVALRVLERFPLGSLHPSTLRSLLYWAYSTFDDPAILPVRHLEGHHYCIETFHGPTASFKDLSLQLLPALMYQAVTTDTALTKAQQQDAGRLKSSAPAKVGLLVATSGDTGTAALSGFARHSESGPVIVLYPRDGVSIVQKLQMLTASSQQGVCVLGVDGDFDFCQTTAKNLLNNKELNAEFSQICPGLILSSANSMNFGRFVPQVVYSLYGYLQLVNQNVIRMGDPVDLTIPTGNFGNLLAAVYARRLGIPIRHLICASNDNNVLADFINTSVYDLRQRAFRQTVSPSIDILVSSNLERFIHMLSNGNTKLVKQLFDQLASDLYFELPQEYKQAVTDEVKSGWCNEQQCLETIRSVFERTKQFIDPHTAVAKYVADHHSPINGDNKVPMLIMATAHWGKFPPAMLSALGNGEPQVNVRDVKPDQLAAAAEQQFAQLTSLQPHKASYLHPELAALTSKPIQRYQTVPADQGVVVKEIKTFLQEIAQGQSRQ